MLVLCVQCSQTSTGSPPRMWVPPLMFPSASPTWEILEGEALLPSIAPAPRKAAGDGQDGATAEWMDGWMKEWMDGQTLFDYAQSDTHVDKVNWRRSWGILANWARGRQNTC